MNENSRLLDAINALGLARRGTLWFIKDVLWEKAIEGYATRRVAHPGLSISTKKYKSLFDTVPMMIGIGRYTPGSFQVEDVTPSCKGRRQVTFFNVIRPRAIPEDEIPPLTIEEFTGNSDDIKRNSAKSTLDAEEMDRLNWYLEKKGINA